MCKLRTVSLLSKTANRSFVGCRNLDVSVDNRLSDTKKHTDLLHKSHFCFFIRHTLVSVLSDAVIFFCVSFCAAPDTSEMVAPIGVLWCTVVKLLSPLLVAISLGVAKWGIQKETRLDQFWPVRHLFLPLDCEYLETVNQSLTSARRELSKNVSHGATE